VTACKFDIGADEAVLDAPVKINHLAVFSQDGMFYFGMAYVCAVTN
jgi:hypothetical protein